MFLIFAEGSDIHPAIWGSLSSVVTAFGMWFLQWSKERRKDRRDERKDALDEWIELHKYDKDKIESLILDMGRLNCEMNDLRDDHLECQKRCAELSARIQVLESALRAAGKEVPIFKEVLIGASAARD